MESIVVVVERSVRRMDVARSTDFLSNAIDCDMHRHHIGPQLDRYSSKYIKVNEMHRGRSRKGQKQCLRNENNYQRIDHQLIQLTIRHKRHTLLANHMYVPVSQNGDIRFQ